jgi:hypothetical protein
MEMNQEDNIKRIRMAVNQADDFDITITVKGSFLVKHQLVDVWRSLRCYDENVIIDNDFEDTISIYQAKFLGITLN